MLDKKLGQLLESVFNRNQDMWFTLLALEIPTKAECDYWNKCEDIWVTQLRNEEENLAYKEAKELKAEMTREDSQELINDQCKMLINCPKITQEMCKLIIFLTSKSE